MDNSKRIHSISTTFLKRKSLRVQNYPIIANKIFWGFWEISPNKFWEFRGKQPNKFWGNRKKRYHLPTKPMCQWMSSARSSLHASPTTATSFTRKTTSKKVPWNIFLHILHIFFKVLSPDTHYGSKRPEVERLPFCIILYLVERMASWEMPMMRCTALSSMPISWKMRKMVLWAISGAYIRNLFTFLH